MMQKTVRNDYYYRYGTYSCSECQAVRSAARGGALLDNQEALRKEAVTRNVSSIVTIFSTGVAPRIAATSIVWKKIREELWIENYGTEQTQIGSADLPPFSRTLG